MCSSFFIRNFQFVLEWRGWQWSRRWCSIELVDVLVVFECILVSFESMLLIFAKLLNNCRFELFGFNFMLLRHLKHTFKYGFFNMLMLFSITCELFYLNFHIMQLIWKCLDILHLGIYLEFCIWWRILVVFQSWQRAFWCRTGHCRLSNYQCWIIWWFRIFFSGSGRWFLMLDNFFLFFLFGILKQLLLPLDIILLIQDLLIFWIVTLVI